MQPRSGRQTRRVTRRRGAAELLERPLTTAYSSDVSRMERRLARLGLMVLGIVGAGGTVLYVLLTVGELFG